MAFAYPSAPLAENRVPAQGILKMLFGPVALAPLLGALAARQGLSALVIVIGVPYVVVALPLATYLVRYRVVVGEGWVAQRGLWRWHQVDLGSLVDVRGRNRNAQRIALRDARGGRVVVWDAVDGAWEVERHLRESVWQCHRAAGFELRPEVRRVLGMPKEKYPPDVATGP